jgi:hypothetical protein
MSDRYFGKIVHVTDAFTVVINRGAEQGVALKEKYIVVGLGQTIKDPDTNEELEQLEIVKGRGEITHVQNKISTLSSIEIEQAPGTREIKKVSNSNVISTLLGTSDVSTELIKPGPEKIGAFKDVQIGDFVILISSKRI